MQRVDNTQNIENLSKRIENYTVAIYGNALKAPAYMRFVFSRIQNGQATRSAILRLQPKGSHATKTKLVSDFLDLSDDTIW